jgi:hypothetical protein
MLNLDVESLSKYVERPHAMHLELHEGIVIGATCHKTTDHKIYIAHIEAFKFLKKDQEKFKFTSFVGEQSSTSVESLQIAHAIYQKTLSCEYEDLELWASIGKRDEKRHEAMQRIKEAYENHHRELDLSYLGLKTLPEFIGNLRVLTGLDVSENHLEHLPESISQLKALSILVLYDNYLTELPETLGNLKSLNALIITNNCLSTLPSSLRELSQLELLSLNENNFETLPEFMGHLSGLKHLKLNDNRLSVLPESIEKLTHLTELHLANNCFHRLPGSLKKLKRSRGSFLFIDLAQNPEKILVNLEAMRADPRPFLEETAFYGLAKSFSFQGEEGVDLGGLSKQYVQDLCHALIVKEVLKTESGLPIVAENKDHEVWQDFGEFLVKLKEKNKDRSDHIFTGRLFSDVFFHIIKVLTTDFSEDTKKIAIAKLLATPFQTPLVTFLETPSPEFDQIESLKTYFLDHMHIPVSSIDPDVLKKDCFSFFAPPYEAAKSLLGGLDQAFVLAIQETSAESMSKSIQGQMINKEDLAKAIVTIKDEAHPVVIEKTAWIREKVLKNSTPLSWLEKFLFALTAQKVMESSLVIHVSANPLDFRCLAHTCFNQLEVPIEDEVPMCEAFEAILPTDSAELIISKRKNMFYKSLDLLVTETKMHAL